MIRVHTIDAMSATGGCHCGGVRYRVEGTLRPVSNCHCEPCRRLTGHHMAATACQTSDIVFGASDSLLWYANSPTTEYGFCNRCGSTLFWRATDKPEHLSITAGTVDPPTGLQTVTALFMAEHGDYHTPEPVADAAEGDRPTITPA